MPIDPTLPFLPISVGVLTVSDTRTEADDRSGALIVERLTAVGHRIAARVIVKDHRPTITLSSRPGSTTPASTSSSPPAAPA
jgi:molybdenum cofactor biosynthesis protein B